MVYTQPRICLGKWNAQNSLRFWNKNGSPNLGNKKKRTYLILYFPVRAKLKEHGKRDKYQKLQKVCNMKVMVIPIAIRAFGTIPKGLFKELKDLEIRGQVETLKTWALLRLARILRRVLETWVVLVSLKFQWEA